MFARMISVAVLAAGLLLTRPDMSLASKPADLPLDLTGKCNESREEPQTRVSFYRWDDPDTESDLSARCCPYLDALSPSLLAMLSELLPPCTQQTAQGDAACDPHWLAQVRHLYLIAQQCRKTGDVAMARNCLRQIGLICPQSSYARLAEQELNQLERRPSGDVIVLVKRTRTGPLVVEAQGEGAEQAQSSGDWWQARFLKAAREIRAYRLRHAPATDEEQVPPAPASREQERIDQLLRSTVPLEIHLDDLPELPTASNHIARWFANALDIDVQPTGIRAAVTISGRLYRLQLEW